MSGVRFIDLDLREVRDSVVNVYAEYARSRGLERSRLWHTWLLKNMQSILRQHRTADVPTVADIGAGGCVVSMCLAKAGAKVTCVDTWGEYDRNDPYGEGFAFGNSKDLLDMLRREGLSPIQHDLTVRPWPLVDGHYDIVTCFDVIEHIWHGKDVLHNVYEISRICKPGGLVFITTPNVAMLRNRLKLLCGMSIYHDLDRWLNTWPYTGHVREFDFSEIRRVFTLAGFTLVGQLATDSMLWNRKGPNKTWMSGIPVSLYGIALAAYSLITWCYPKWRHTFLSIFVRN
jgi:2-polyprenyl-3-methyl-5-hydroxy-6-metoxy-1,4-benzoquinol methylase